MNWLRAAMLMLAMLGGAQAQTYLPDVSSDKLFGELLWHTLAYRQDIAIYPGEFAPRMPLEIALPTGARLIGSTVREYGSRTREVTVVIESKLTYSEIGKFFRPSIKAPWQERQPIASGFSFSTDVRNGEGFLPLCNTQTGTRIQIYSSPKDQSNWETSPNYIYINFFESAQSKPGCGEDAWRFPVVLLPRNAMPINGNGFGFGDFTYQSMWLTVPSTSSKTLFEQFSKQLPASWKQLSLSESTDGMVGVYQYTDAGQSGIALLSVNSFAERPDTYVARLTAFPRL
jgi:hypothetical protein